MIKPAQTLLAASVLAYCPVWAELANAQDMDAPPAAIRVDPTPASSSSDDPGPVPPYNLHARVMVGDREMWSGYLAMTNYGRANVRTYVQDMDANCPLKRNRFQVRRHTIDLSVAPGSRKGPYLYTIEANWTAPAEPCSDEGARATGVRIEVDLSENPSRVIEGERGLRVEIARLP